jgi:pilus assembly protein CpaE
LVSTIHRVFDMSLTRGPLVPASRVNELQMGKESGTVVKRGKIITVFGAKGGVGASTIAVNLAISLVDAKTRVCLVDADLQFGDTAVLLNLQAQRHIADLIQHLDELDADYLNTVLTAHPSGLKALLAPPRPEMAELVTAEHMKAVLDELKRAFDIVIIDSPTNFNDVNLATLDLSERVLLVTSADIPALKNARLFFDVTEALDYPKDKVVLIVNKFDKRMTNIGLKDIAEAIKHPVTRELPLDLRNCTTSANRGEPLILADRKLALSQAVFALAEQVRQALNLSTPEADEHESPAGARSGHSFGFLGRLLGWT